MGKLWRVSYFSNYCQRSCMTGEKVGSLYPARIFSKKILALLNYDSLKSVSLKPTLEDTLPSK